MPRTSLISTTFDATSTADDAGAANAQCNDDQPYLQALQQHALIGDEPRRSPIRRSQLSPRRGELLVFIVPSGQPRLAGDGLGQPAHPEQQQENPDQELYPTDPGTQCQHSSGSGGQSD